MSMITDESDLLIGRGLDPDKWSITKVWSSSSNAAPGFSAERKIGMADAERIGARMRALIEKARKQVGAARPRSSRTGLLEIAGSDWHIGAWSDGSAAEHSERCITTAMRLVERSVEAFPSIGECLLVLNGDTVHVDSIRGETTKGTRLEDVSDSYDVILSEAMSAICALINWLRKHWPTRVEVVPGNHDFHAAISLGRELEAYYRNDKRVDIGHGPEKMRGIRWGTCLLGLIHGDTAGRGLSKLPGLMASEWPEDWGQTTHHEWHVGHAHTLMYKEAGGCRIRGLPALASRSEWAKNQAFSKTLQGFEAYLWDKELGYRGHLHEPPA